jgi:hypothetical protein
MTRFLKGRSYSWPKQLKDQLLADYNNGKLIKTIADDYELTAAEVGRWLREEAKVCTSDNARSVKQYPTQEEIRRMCQELKERHFKEMRESNEPLHLDTGKTCLQDD